MFKYEYVCNYSVLSGPEIFLSASKGMSLSFQSFEKGMSGYHIDTCSLIFIRL